MNMNGTNEVSIERNLVNIPEDYRLDPWGESYLAFYNRVILA